MIAGERVSARGGMDTRSALAALAALAQETRLAVFRLLVEAGPAGRAAGQIAEALTIPASSLSFHLAHLTHAGLIRQRRASRSLIYAADMTAMNALVGYLTENCCGGNPAACAPSSSIDENAEPMTSTRRTA